MKKSKIDGGMEKLVKKGHWGQIQKVYTLSDPSTLAELAQACSASRSVEAQNVANTLMKNPNEQVKMAAARTLGQIGNARSASLMRSALRSADPESKDLISQLEESISMLSGDTAKSKKKSKK